MKRLIVASNNAHKAEEIADLLSRDGVAITVVNARVFGGMPAVDETGATFAANARLKAEAMLAVARTHATENGQRFDDLVLADDSGLAVDCLDGAPGVYSARFAGPDATDADNNAKLLAALDGVPTAQRGARFVCCLVLLGDGVDATFNGACEGRILTEPAGHEGFGYDPLFAPKGHAETFAQLGPEVKQRVSHRFQACHALAQWLMAR